MKKIIAILLCLNIVFAPFCMAEITDDFVESSLNKNLKIKNHQYIPIDDNFVKLNKNINPPKKFVEIKEITPSMPKKKFSPRVVIFDNNCKEIKVKIKDFYSTKNKLSEGDYIDFITINDIKIKDKLYPKNTIVKARIETISENGAFGIPSDVIIGNFSIDDTFLSGEIKKRGANRSLWLYPTVYVTSCFFGIGLLLIPIRGGHAKIQPKETFTLYSY